MGSVCEKSARRDVARSIDEPLSPDDEDDKVLYGALRTPNNNKSGPLASQGGGGYDLKDEDSVIAQKHSSQYASARRRSMSDGSKSLLPSCL